MFTHVFAGAHDRQKLCAGKNSKYVDFPHFSIINGFVFKRAVFSSLKFIYLPKLIPKTEVLSMLQSIYYLQFDLNKIM